MRVVIGIGANLGDRLLVMRDAVARLEHVNGVRVVRRSSIYQTAPVGGVEQPAFLNAAVSVECMLSGAALLEELLRIERELGRVRDQDTVRWGPRAIDLDILWIEGVTIDAQTLTVPHPRLAERAFALVPMHDVAPDARDPRSGLAYVVPEDGSVQLTNDTL